MSAACCRAGLLLLALLAAWMLAPFIPAMLIAAIVGYLLMPVYDRLGRFIPNVHARASVMLDYKSVATRLPEIVWRDECVTIELPGRTRGRVWVDAATDDVLRVEEHLTEMFEFTVPAEHRRPGDAYTWVVERADSTIQYRPVVFHDPDETMMLPASIQSLTIVRNAGVPRLRS